MLSLIDFIVEIEGVGIKFFVRKFEFLFKLDGGGLSRMITSSSSSKIVLIILDFEEKLLTLVERVWELLEDGMGLEREELTGANEVDRDEDDTVLVGV
jgi:hypothetical protein